MHTRQQVAVKAFPKKPSGVSNGQAEIDRRRAANTAPTAKAAKTAARGGGAAAVAVLSAVDELCLELQVLRRLQPSQHAGVANMAVMADTRGTTYALLEYCGGGSLRRQLQGLQRRGRGVGLSEVEARPMLQQLVHALCHLHAVMGQSAPARSNPLRPHHRDHTTAPEARPRAQGCPSGPREESPRSVQAPSEAAAAPLVCLPQGCRFPPAAGHAG